MLAFRDHEIITTSSNKTEPNETYTDRLIIESSAHNYLEANIIWSKNVFFLFSSERSGLVALFAGVDIHVNYAWPAVL